MSKMRPAVLKANDARMVLSQQRLAVLFVFLASVLFVTFGRDELSCDQRGILRILSSLLAGLLASAYFRGKSWLQIGGRSRQWLISATGGFAVFTLAYVLPLQQWSAPCVTLQANTARLVNLFGQIEIAGMSTGVATVRLSDLAEPINTSADGSFSVKGLIIRSSIHVVVEYQRQDFAFDIARPYGQGEMHVILDLASRTYRFANS